MSLGLAVLAVTLLAIIIERIFFRKKKFKPFEKGQVLLNSAPEGGQENIQLYVRITITLVLLCASLYIILFNQQNEAGIKFAIGTIGTITGYWLKT